MPIWLRANLFLLKCDRFIDTARQTDSVCFARPQTMFWHFLAPEKIEPGNILKTEQCKMMLVTYLFY